MSTATATRRRTKKAAVKGQRKAKKPVHTEPATTSAPAAKPDPRRKGIAPQREGPRPKPKMRSSPPPVDLEVDPDVLEFIKAIDDYRATHDRPFPTWSEVLYVLKGLGYRKA